MDGIEGLILCGICTLTGSGVGAGVGVGLDYIRIDKDNR